IWRDRTSLRVGDNWRAEVEFGIRNADEIVVLLTPDASRSDPVVYEIAFAIQNNKRVNLFATFDPRTIPGIFELVSEINYVTLPTTNLFADRMGRHLLGNPASVHPVGIREFEWLASRRIFPRFAELLVQGRIDAAVVNHYLAYRSAFEQQAGR